MMIQWNDVKNAIKDFVFFISIYLFWSLVHVIASTMYSKFCAPMTILGILSSGFMTITPHCKAAHWLIMSTSQGFNAWFITLSTWCITKMKLFVSNEIPHGNHDHQHYE